MKPMQVAPFPCFSTVVRGCRSDVPSHPQPRSTSNKADRGSLGCIIGLVCEKRESENTFISTAVCH